MPKALLEIGVEEVPARFVRGALKDLSYQVKRNLEDQGISFSKMMTFGTPRRLALIVEGIPERQPDRVREAFGPPKKAAIGPDGKFTQAGIKFAQSNGARPEDLLVKPKDGKGEYMVARVEEKGLSASEFMTEVFRESVIGLSMTFPKSMRWSDKPMRFVRPIHRIAALIDSEALSFEIAGVKSSGATTGHRFLSPSEIELKSPDEYVGRLRDAFVFADPEERKSIIRSQIETLAKSAGGEAVMDEELLETVSFLVEFPSAVMAGFEEKFLALPDELLMTVLKGHQKYFSIKKGKAGNGRLLNRFIVVSNTKPENEKPVRAGAERVVRARFEDARFYFEEDLKRPLSARVAELKGVTYHERLGTLYEKMERTRELAGAYAEMIKPSLAGMARRAAELSKADLVTGVVREFPELQGIMGSYYALRESESPELATALREQYLAGSDVKTDLGAILSLADRMDNLGAFFSIELLPTGSEDPFALRRQAMYVIGIISAMDYPVTIDALIERAAEPFSGSCDTEALAEELRAFFIQRLEPLFQTKGHSLDVIRSCAGFFTTDPLSAVGRRLETIKVFQSEPGYQDFLIAVKRVRNIMPGSKFDMPDPALFRTPEESALYESAKGIEKRLRKFLDEADYVRAIREARTLGVPINSFFEKVLVMDKDEAVKKNRLCLLGYVWSLASMIADFSALREIS